MLVPGQDSGRNLHLLMADEKMAAMEVKPPDIKENGSVPLQMASSSLAQPKAAESVQPDGGDYGTRCISNAAGRAAFIAALNKSEGIPDAEKQLLAEARQKFKPICADAPGFIWRCQGCQQKQ